MLKANYMIIQDDFLQEEPLVIEDIGPWDQYATITNAAEVVVTELVARGMLPTGRRLFYYDSDGMLGELSIENDKFNGSKLFTPEIRAQYKHRETRK